MGELLQWPGNTYCRTVNLAYWHTIGKRVLGEGGGGGWMVTTYSQEKTKLPLWEHSSLWLSAICGQEFRAASCLDPSTWLRVRFSGSSRTDPNCLSNYRPVSNLPFLSKVLERIALKQFLQHLESHSLPEPFQSAYRKCHSTETAMLRLVSDLLQASDSGHMSILSLLGLSVAFDTIDHDILIKRLHTTFACSGTVLDWFTSYLSFRTQHVFVGHASTPSALKCGVPQGSVLGPLLFTLYTQSLSTVICQSGHSYYFFADDSQLHNSSIPSDFPAFVHSLKDCIEDVAESQYVKYEPW